MANEFTYSDDLFSDLYKDAYGVRPSSWISAQWDEMSAVEKQTKWDSLIDEMEASQRREAEESLDAQRDLENRIAEMIGLGAEDRATAIRWIIDADAPSWGVNNTQDVEHIVWQLGVMFIGDDLYVNEFQAAWEG